MTLAVRIVIALLAAFTPTVVYVLAVWWLDRYEREPVRLMLVAFAWGALPALIISVALELVLGDSLLVLEPVLLRDAATGGLLAPVVEETAKGVILLLLFLRAPFDIDSVLDGIVYGAVVGFGMAMTENSLVYLDVLGRGNWQSLAGLVVLRSVLFGFNHAFYTAIIGAGFGLAMVVQMRRAWQRWLFPVLGLGLAIAFHGVHNLGIILAETNDLALPIVLVTNVGGLVVLMVVAVLAWRQERDWIVSELLPEVGDTLSQDEYQAASAYGRRAVLWLKTWRRLGLAEARQASLRFNLLTKLAFLKRRLRQEGQSPGLEHQIEQVRASLRSGRST